MFAVLSPAKKLNFDPKEGLAKTRPVFEDRAYELATVMKTYSVSSIRQLMNLSEDLGKLNHARFQAFEKSAGEQNGKQAGFAFAGDTYQGLDIDCFDDGDLAYAQDHLRILSGLYGLLRPLDVIQPYRLEMGRKVKSDRGETLYDYWGVDLAKELDKTGMPVLNLASVEYFKTVEKHLASPVITPLFKEDKGDKLVSIGFFAKQARGMMARYLVKHRIDNPEALKDFDLGGYAYQAELSKGNRWVFTRPSKT